MITPPVGEHPGYVPAVPLEAARPTMGDDIALDGICPAAPEREPEFPCGSGLRCDGPPRDGPDPGSGAAPPCDAWFFHQGLSGIRGKLVGQSTQTGALCQALIGVVLLAYETCLKTMLSPSPSACAASGKLIATLET